jgi:hypothetical protein
MHKLAPAGEVVLTRGVALKCVTPKICQIYDRQDQQGKAVSNERNQHTTQQDSAARSSEGPPNENRTGRKAAHGQDNILFRRNMLVRRKIKNYHIRKMNV